MTAARTVTYCARCGALEAMHEIRADGTRGRRLGTPDGCPGYQPGRIEERPPEDELRRRLDRIVSLLLVADTTQGACCARGRRQAERVIRIARGEDAPLDGVVVAVDGKEAANVPVQLELSGGET